MASSDHLSSHWLSKRCQFDSVDGDVEGHVAGLQALIDPMHHARLQNDFYTLSNIILIPPVDIKLRPRNPVTQ